MKKEEVIYPRIGTVVFLVNKQSVKLKLANVKVIPAKIVGYETIDGKVYPTLTSKGKEISPIYNNVHYDLEKAINSIQR